MKEPNNKRDEEMEYLYFSRAYLILSYKVVEEVIKKIDKKTYSNPFGEIFPDWVYEKNYLLIPAFYNLKHAIEISIKTLYRFLDMQPDTTHDLKRLFEKISKELKNQVKVQEINKLDNLITEYQSNSMLENKLSKNIKIEDRENNVFRYPDNNANVKLNFLDILPLFTVTELREIQKDIKNIDELFYKIGREILEKKYGQLIVERKTIFRLKSKRDDPNPNPTT